MDTKTNDDNTLPEEVPVTNSHIMRMASAKCSLCYGTGRVLLRVLDEANPNSNSPSFLKEKLCGCAQKRFFKKYYPYVGLNPDGGMIWLEKPEDIDL